jgi:hypothetical protein
MHALIRLAHALANSGHRPNPALKRTQAHAPGPLSFNR